MAQNTKNPGRIPPQNLESERALLGSIMLKPEGMSDAIDTISPDSFYAEKHRFIFQAMLELFSRSEPIDLLSLSTKLKEKGKLDQVGGGAYLAELVNAVPSASNLNHYAKIVQKKAIMRGLIDVSRHVGELGYADEHDIEYLLDEAEKKVFAVTNAPIGQKFVSIRETLGDVWERLESLHGKKDDIRGVPSGFKSLDDHLAGFQKSDLIILAARPSMGKTALALDIARQAATLHNVPVGIFSLEMSAQQLVDRMLAAESRVDAWKLRTGKLTADEEFSRIRDSLDKLSKAPIFIDDKASNTVLGMRSTARRLKSEHGLGLIIVDYLQLMAPSRNYDSMVHQVTEISRSLKSLARELDVPVIALSQLSRAVEQRQGRPRLSDLRDSGCIAGDTLIMRADTGERVPIKDMVGEKNIPIYGVDKNMNMRVYHASKIFPSGEKRLFTITTRSGRTIRASANHKFYTIDGWKRLDEIAPKTALGLPRSFVSPGKRGGSLSRDEIGLLAHLLGDGCILPRQPFHYTSADIRNIEFVEGAAARIFGIHTRRIAQDNWWYAYLPSPTRLARGRQHPITKWYASLGLSLVRSYEKKIPAAIFCADNRDVAYFLHHLWATDGNISAVRDSAERIIGAAIYYASSSRALAEGVQHLLLRLGIWSTLRKAEQGKYRPNWHVAIQGKTAQNLFLKTVGSYGARGDMTKMLLGVLRAIKGNPNTDIIPRAIWDSAVAGAKMRSGLSWRDVARELSISYDGAARQKNGISRERMTRIATALKSETLAAFASSDIFWDEIVTIERGGIEMVYDATVAGAHNFVANDFIVHNSIEQDADVVMFIHREDKQQKSDSAQPNIAEILIEKHRNGPTGKIELYFDEKKTTFLSIEKSGGHGDGRAGDFDDF